MKITMWMLACVWACCGPNSALADTPLGCTWGQVLGGPGTDSVTAVAADSNGNSYAAGYFAGTAHFGITNLTAQGAQDLFITKLSSAGSVVWVRQVKGQAGSGQVIPKNVAVDSQGNLYLCGNFFGTVTFGTTTFNNAGGSDAFIAKLTPNGDFTWANQMSSASDDFANSLAVGSQGQVYVTGAFNGAINIGGTILPNGGAQSCYVAAFSSSGALAWAERFGGSQTVNGQSLALGVNGELYLGGSFSGAVVFSSQLIVTSNGSYDAFLARLGSDGTPVWAKCFGGTAYDYAQGLAVSTNGQIYLTGGITGNAVFGSTNVTAQSSSDFFVVNCSTDGTVRWVLTATNSLGQTIATDTNGVAYVAGNYTSTFTLGGFSVGSGSGGMFVAVIASNGVAQTVANLSSTSSNFAPLALAIPFDKGVLVGGYFTSNLALYGNNLSGTGVGSGLDAFVVRLDPLALTIKAQVGSGGVRLSWASAFSNVVLQATQNLQGGGSWSDVSAQTDTSGNETGVTVPISGSQNFYKLKK